MTLSLEQKSQYGTTRFYPKNSTATKVASLLGKKTLTQVDIKKLESIGFDVRFKAIK